MEWNFTTRIILRGTPERLGRGKMQLLVPDAISKRTAWIKLYSNVLNSPTKVKIGHGFIKFLD